MERGTKMIQIKNWKTDEIIHQVNQPFSKFRFGPLPDVTKVSLIVHQDGNGGAALVREPTILDVINGYAEYIPPTPTQTYDPYIDPPNVGIRRYRVLVFLIKVVEGKEEYIGLMKQSNRLKYEVT